MLNDILLHPQTRENIDRLVRGNTHAILIEGPMGAGKHTLALATAAYYLQKTSEQQVMTHPYFKIVLPEKGSIGIEHIRSLKRFVSLKTTGINPVRRIVLLEEAHAMTTEAQNALLKILEEPPSDTVLLLTSADQKLLKPTILSRVQTIGIIPPSRQAASEYFGTKGSSATAIEQAFVLSKGYTGLLTALLENDTTHPLVLSIDRAKVLLRAKTYDRLVQVDELSKNKESAVNLTLALKRIAIAGLDQASQKNQSEVVQRWHRQLIVLHRSESLLVTNTNTKLVLTDMFLQM